MATKSSLTIRTAPEIKQRLEELAAQERRSVGQFVAHLIEDVVAQRQAQSVASAIAGAN